MHNLSPTVALAGVPFDAHSSFMTGPALAPSRIRECLHNGAGNYWTERGFNPIEHKQFRDIGDFDVSDYLSIADTADQAIQRGQRLLTLGGDHSITYPLLKAHRQHYTEYAVLQIDAHGDLYDNFMGNRYSHACPFARIMEEGLCDRLVQVGIRTLNPHQHQQAEAFGVEQIEMRHLSEKINELHFTRPLYISFDMDGIDPAFAPGVSHHEPGGLTVREVMQLLHNIQVPIIGADIVEYNPHRDHQGITAALAAKLTKEILELMLH
ncbi:MAG: agmatinase [Bacteroidota bacterium]